MVGAARLVGGAVAQVGIELALNKAAFNKDVNKTTKETENAFSKSFKKIGSTTKSAFSAIGNTISNALSRVKEKVQATFNKIGNIIKVVAVAAGAYMVKFSKDAISAASETQAAWTGLNSIVVGTGGSFSEAQGFLKEYVSDGLIPLTNAVTAYKNLAARGYSTEQIEQTLTALKDAAAFGRQSSYSYGDAITSATEGLKNENSILVDNAGVTKNVAKMWDEYAASIGTTANNLTQQQKIQAEVNGILEETKFQTGDATRYADTYAGKIAKLSTAFYNLKVTVGQVLTPIVELFLPAITAAINGLTKMFNKLKSIMAVFGLEMKEYIGKDSSSAISSATDSAGALSDNLDSSGNAGKKAANKIKKAFSKLDEINVLSFNKNNSSSGSSGAGGSGGAGDLGGDTGSTIESGLEETQDKVTQNLEWLKRSAYDWGVAFGESINKGLEKIPWDKIQSSVNGAVKKVAEFLNGAIEGLDWHLLGSTFGNGFNTIIYGLNTWYETFDWVNLGKKLGDGVDGIIDSVDFEAIGHYFALKFNSIFEVASNFLGTVKWGDLGKNIINGLNTTIAELNFGPVGKTLENGLNGAIDFMWNAVTTFDAKKAGEKIAELINNITSAIKNTDWKKLGKTFQEGFSKGFEMFHTFIKETDWAELGESLVKGIMDFILQINYLELMKNLGTLYLDIGGAIIDGILGGIKGAVKSIGERLKEALIDPIVNKVKELFGIKSPSTVFAEIGDYLIQGLWQGILNAKDWILKKWDEVKGWFTNIVKTASIKIPQKWSDIKKNWTDLTSNIKNKTADMKAKVATKWKDIKESWVDTTKNIKNKTADMKAKVVTRWSNIKKNWTNITSNIKNKTADMKARIATTWSSLKNTWNNLMSNFKDKTITIKAKVGEVVGSFKGTINDKLIKPINNKLPNWMAKIPYLAQGGWVKANNPTLTVVGDNKKEPEIVTPESKIKEQVIKGMQEVRATNNQIELVINVKYEDGRSIIKKINNTQIKDGKISLLV